LGITVAIVNEYDLVSRIDQSYIRSLVDLYRSLFQLNPIPDDESTKSDTSSTLAESSLDSEGSLLQKAKMWNLPKPAFWLLGEIVLLRIEAVEVRADNAVAWPTVTMQRILMPFTVEPEEFARLVFCRVAVHRRVEYEKRIEMLLGGQ
jgi:hypothetical protein